jgi:hypothetical protein
MSYMSQRIQPLCEGVMQKLLAAVKEEILKVKEEWLRKEYIKFGAAAALAVCVCVLGFRFQG